MSVLLNIAAAVVLAPTQAGAPPKGQIELGPRIEGIPAATKLVPLKGFEVDVAKLKLVKFRPLNPAFKFDKDLRDEAKARTGLARDQGNRPTGSIHAFTFLAEFVFSKKTGQMNVNLSEEYLNRLANYVCGNMQDGDHMLNAMRAYMAGGVCRESILPYRPVYLPNLGITAVMRADGIAHRRGTPVNIRPFGQGSVPPQNLPGSPPWNVQPGQGVTPAHLEAIKLHLNAGFPVMVSVRWPDEPAFGTTDIAGIDLMKLPPPTQSHFQKGVAIVGYKNDNRFPGGGVFVFRNSDGTGWGDLGHGYLSYNYVRNLGMGLMALR